MKTHRPATKRRDRRLDETPVVATGHEEAAVSPAQSLEMVRSPAFDVVERGRAMLRLQGAVGNAAVARELAQREGDGKEPDSTRPPLLTPPQLKLRLLSMQGVASTNPLTLRLPPAAKRPLPKWLNPDNPEYLKQFWKLKFKLEVEPDSALAEALERQEKLEFVIGAEQADSLLGLQLLNTAVNMLPATKSGEVIAKMLMLDKLTIYFDPKKGVYGAGLILKF
jgi:hypothetical protein